MNSLCSRLATDTKQMRPLSTTAISFPSGDQAKIREANPVELIASAGEASLCPSRRSWPPNDGTESTSLPWSDSRAKAI